MLSSVLKFNAEPQWRVIAENKNHDFDGQNGFIEKKPKRGLRIGKGVEE